MAERMTKTSHHLVEFCDKIIETTVTSEASVAEDWIQSIINLPKQNGGNRVIGMDCKFIHHPIRSMSNKIAILQLCVATKCLMLQLLHMEYIPQSIRVFLSDSRTTFVGVEIQENSRKLMQEYELVVKQKVDIHFLVKRWFPISYRGRPSMKALALGVVGFSMRKRSKNYDHEGDWKSRVLNKELVEQACVDVYTSYSIAHKLLKD